MVGPAQHLVLVRADGAEPPFHIDRLLLDCYVNMKETFNVSHCILESFCYCTLAYALTHETTQKTLTAVGTSKIVIIFIVLMLFYHLMYSPMHGSCRFHIKNQQQQQRTA